MSLAQHVSAVEGPDRVDLASLYDAPDNASLQLGRRLSLTLSYDPLPKTDAAEAEKPETVGAYKISTLRRTGKLIAGWPTYFLTESSPGQRRSHYMRPCIRHCLRLRGFETDSPRRRGLSRSLYSRGA